MPSWSNRGTGSRNSRSKRGTSRGYQGDSVGIAWNLASWTETTFWSKSM